MAWTHIASATGSADGTLLINSTGANFLIAAIRYYGGSSGFQNVGNGMSNSWTQIGTTVDVGGQKLDVYYCDAPAYVGVSTGVGGSNGYFTVSIAAFSRPTGSLTVGTPATATATAATSLASGSLTPAANDALIATWLSFNGDVGAPTAPSGFTAAGLLSSINASRYGGGQAYLNQTTAAAVNPSWSVPSSSDLAVTAVAFTAATGPDVTPPTLSGPTATGGTLSCSGSVTTNEGNGTLYTAFTASATAPTALQVESGQDNTGAAALRADSQAVNSAGAQSVPSGSITAGTRYAHYMHKDAAGNRSAVVTSASFTVSSGADTTAPTLSGASATGGILVCAGSVTTNEGNGNLYVVFTDSATAPSASQVKSGLNQSGAAALRAVSQAVTTTGAQTIAAGSITAGTRYAHFMHEDAALNQSAVVSSAAFSVTAGGSATVSLNGFKTWTGVPYASATVSFVKVFRVSNGSLALELANQSINASGNMTITSTSLAAAVDYMVFGFNADGSLSFKKKVTAV